MVGITLFTEYNCLQVSLESTLAKVTKYGSCQNVVARTFPALILFAQVIKSFFEDIRCSARSDTKSIEDPIFQLQ